jgi:hypothetical protein
LVNVKDFKPISSLPGTQRSSALQQHPNILSRGSDG